VIPVIPVVDPVRAIEIRPKILKPQHPTSEIGSRDPFGRATKLEQVPSVIFEILCLARELKTPKGDQIAGLIDDMIGVALDDPDAWLKFKNGRRGVQKRNFPPGIVIPRK
jgi:hypothetical protein